MLDEPAATLAHVASISVEPVLCRICERDIPDWFFEKNSEICNETHRLDMEIGECNESLRELRRAIQDLHNRLENFTGQSAEPPLEYRGVAITTPPASNQRTRTVKHAVTWKLYNNLAHLEGFPYLPVLGSLVE